MNPVVHFEMPYQDPTRMAAFYASVFGWETRALGPEMGNYVLATTAVADARPGTPAGAINGGFFARQADQPHQYPSIVIAVTDIAAARTAVSAAGGQLLGEVMAIPGVGQYASFLDTEGNRCSMLQPIPPP